MSKFKVGGEFIENGTVGKITSIEKDGYIDNIFCRNEVYRWEYVSGKHPVTSIRAFMKYSVKYRQALPYTRLAMLLYGLKNE